VKAVDDHRHLGDRRDLWLRVAARFPDLKWLVAGRLALDAAALRAAGQCPALTRLTLLLSAPKMGQGRPREARHLPAKCLHPGPFAAHSPIQGSTHPRKAFSQLRLKRPDLAIDSCFSSDGGGNEIPSTRFYAG
jgi:hypothetical protein